MKSAGPVYERLWEKKILGARLDSLAPETAEYLLAEIERIEKEIDESDDFPPVVDED